MRRVWFRVGLVIVMLGGIVASGNHILLSQQRISVEQAGERAFATDAWTLALSLIDLHAAQQAYVGTGQDRYYWMAAVRRRLEAAASQLASLSRASTAPSAAEALDAAAATLDSFREMDARIRGHMTGDRLLLASDLLYGDALELTRQAVGHVEAAQAAEQVARDASVAADRESQGLALMAATGASLSVALLLLPPVRTPRENTDAESVVSEPADTDVDAATDATSSSATSAATSLEDSDAGSGGAAADAEQAGVLGLSGYLPAERPPVERGSAPTEDVSPVVLPDLQLTADLCTDLVRSTSAADLPSLLARSAQTLNAAGVVLWVLDNTGAALRPAISHGYASKTLARIGRLPCNGDNATAAAWRDARMHVVPSTANGGTRGAIAAPLVSPDRCAGVLSLELNDGWETNAAVQSAAAIIAAQLATLVSADPVTSEAATRAHA